MTGAQLAAGWEIATPSKDLLALLAERAPGSERGELVARRERDALDSWLWGKDTLDLLQLLPEVVLEVDDLARVFRPLQHRAYSISSSPLHSPDRIHLTRTGYEKTADAFASFLTPYVKKGLAAH